MNTPIRTAFSESYFCPTPQVSMRKLPLVADQASKNGFANLIPPSPATVEQLNTTHNPKYVQDIITGQGELSKCAFGFWSEQYRDGVLAINGGNLLAAKMALEDGIAANIGQGFHHAGYDHGGGFCTFNGLALVAALNPELSILVIDCDEHGGNGTAELTDRIPRLTNFSICGWTFGARETKRSIVRSVKPHDTRTYKRYVSEALEFTELTKPDLIIYQAGMDPHENDPLSQSRMPTETLEWRDKIIMETLALDLHIPFFFVLAGGYQQPMEEKLIPLHLKTFEIASKINAQIHG